MWYNIWHFVCKHKEELKRCHNIQNDRQKEEDLKRWMLKRRGRLHNVVVERALQ